MSEVKAGIIVSGVIDGATVAYDIIVVEEDLTPTTITQYFSDTQCVPDWAAIWAGSDSEAKRSLPRIVVKARNVATGADLTRTVAITAVWYNGSQVTFGSDGISTGLVMPGVLRKTTIMYGSHEVPCIQLVGNPASALLNPDSDIIEIDGTVVCDGGQMTFSKKPIHLPIRPLESGTGSYSVELLTPANVDKYIYNDPDTNTPVATKRIAQLRLDNIPLSQEDLSGYYVKWYDISGPDEVELVPGTNISFAKSKMTNDTITIGAGAVNSTMTFAAKVFSPDDSTNPVAIGVAATIDYTDPWEPRWTVKSAVEAAEGVEYSGALPEVPLRRGQSRYFFPRLYNSVGEYPSAVSWTFNFDDAATAAPITGIPTGTDSHGNSYCKIDFDNVVVGGVSRKIAIHGNASV